jgi:hypothetical protein
MIETPFNGFAPSSGVLWTELSVLIRQILVVILREFDWDWILQKGPGSRMSAQAMPKISHHCHLDFN